MRLRILSAGWTPQETNMPSTLMPELLSSAAASVVAVMGVFVVVKLVCGGPKASGSVVSILLHRW